MVNAVSSNYNEWISSLNSRGIKTTRLGNGEANFADYTNALSDSLKQEIMASFDTDADYDLQSKLASLLGGSNLIQSRDMSKTLAGSGISYSVQYVKTSYIPDNKADGHYDKNVTNGAIAVYTFKDANGGEIKIADANGNGALESEELFMNELLSGVVSDIQAASAPQASSGGAPAVDNTQAIIDAQIQALQEQLDAQLQEQQRVFEEAMQALQMQSAAGQQVDLTSVEIKPEQNKPETASEAQKAETKGQEPDGGVDEDEIKKDAERLLQDADTSFTTHQLNDMIDDVIELVQTKGITVEKAVELVLEDAEA